jgi:hypothetical protein
VGALGLGWALNSRLGAWGVGGGLGRGTAAAEGSTGSPPSPANPRRFEARETEEEREEEEEEEEVAAGDRPPGPSLAEELRGHVVDTSAEGLDSELDKVGRRCCFPPSIRLSIQIRSRSNIGLSIQINPGSVWGVRPSGDPGSRGGAWRGERRGAGQRARQGGAPVGPRTPRP